MTTEYALRECVFHFNKKHLEDPNIPMWVLKFNGNRTLYINHLTSTVPWSTKETPGNDHTKGSIKFKNCLLTINDDNEATLSLLSKEDRERLKKSKGAFARILIDNNLGGIKRYMDNQGIEYGKIRKVSGGCGTLFYICDIFTKEDAALLSLIYHDNYRILQPNEEYYKWYDQKDQDLLNQDIITTGMFSNGDEDITDADEDDWQDDENE